MLAFKQKIAEKAGVAPELQRLIYKGRVLKEDQNTLASYSESASPVHSKLLGLVTPAWWRTRVLGAGSAVCAEGREALLSGWML